MRRQQQGALWQELLVSMNQSIDYPSKCKFGFHSVLANTLEHLLGMIKVSALPVFRIVCLLLRRQTVHLTRMVQSTIDRLFIVHIIARSVPLINYWQQTLCRGLILFTLSRYHEDAMSIVAVVGASESRSRQTFASYVTASLSWYE
jgi:hypothetical protein